MRIFNKIKTNKRNYIELYTYIDTNMQILVEKEKKIAK